MLREFIDDDTYVYCQVGLFDSFKKDTSNDTNGRGRKICPITFTELRSDNAIQIGNTIYSTNGLHGLIKRQSWYPNFANSEDYLFNASILQEIKNPTTNIAFTKEEASLICSLILKKKPYFES
jgi:hypothetical protein